MSYPVIQISQTLNNTHFLFSDKFSWGLFPIDFNVYFLWFLIQSFKLDQEGLPNICALSLIKFLYSNFPGNVEPTICVWK